MSKAQNIRNLIQNVKRKQNLTWDGMSNITGIPKTTLIRLSKQEMDPSVDTLTRLAECFNVSTDILLEVSNDCVSRCSQCRYFIIVRIISYLLDVGTDTDSLAEVLEELLNN